MAGAETDVWSVAGRSVMGAAHVRAGIPNQDAIAWAPRAGSASTAVLALADGHGASPHFRSGTGSHIAVEAAISLLTEQLADAAWIAAKDIARARAIADEIIARWRSAVNEHVAANPLGLHEDDIYVPYGSTLIAAAVAPEGLFLMQLGDGDLLIGSPEGALARPLPDDEGMIGQQTYSLCQADAEAFVRMQLLPAREAAVDFIMLSTDGLAKSFRSEQAFRRHAASWRSLVLLAGLSAATDRLDRWLSEVSEYGSGDDITLGFMVREPPENEGRKDRLRSFMAGAGAPPSAQAGATAGIRQSAALPAAVLMGAPVALVLAVACGYFLGRCLL